MYCYRCGIVGHRAMDCKQPVGPSDRRNGRDAKNASLSDGGNENGGAGDMQHDTGVNGEGNIVEKDLYGPWLVVQSARGRRRNGKGSLIHSMPTNVMNSGEKVPGEGTVMARMVDRSGFGSRFNPSERSPDIISQ